MVSSFCAILSLGSDGIKRRREGRKIGTRVIIQQRKSVENFLLHIGNRQKADEGR